MAIGALPVGMYALGELAHWGQDLDQDPIDRAYGQVGIRASMPMWTADNTVESQLWNVHGIAHKVVFEAEFAYTVYIFEDTTALSRQVEVFRQELWRYLGGAGLILLLLQTVILRWSLLPLRRVIHELKRVQRGAGDGSERWVEYLCPAGQPFARKQMPAATRPQVRGYVLQDARSGQAGVPSI